MQSGNSRGRGELSFFPFLHKEFFNQSRDGVSPESISPCNLLTSSLTFLWHCPMQLLILEHKINIVNSLKAPSAKLTPYHCRGKKPFIGLWGQVKATKQQTNKTKLMSPFLMGEGLGVG